MPPDVPTLVAEATRRSGVVWLAAPGGRPHLVWHLWHDGAAYVVGGGDEQALPALGRTATVVVRSGSRARLVEWTAAVEVVPPDTARWAEVVPLLAAGRLNAPSVAGLPGLWALRSTVLRLVPRDTG